MQADFAFLCDHADVSGPKLHAHGIGIDTAYIPEMPGVMAGFWFCAAVSASAAELGQKQLQIRLMGPDGQDVIPPQGGPFAIPPSPVAGHPSVARIAVQFANVTFPAYGEYGVHLVIDGHELKSLGLRIAPPVQAATA